ncbi:MAG: hypothetical protein GF390_03060 [Candidatus Pacebacteria bacterium]|nr:hypothetical protein [Candidatus Paceibacterota bacterium]
MSTKTTATQDSLLTSDQPPLWLNSLSTDDPVELVNKTTLVYPGYFQKTLNETQRDYYHQHGQIELVYALSLQVITELDHCQQLWQEFNQAQSLFDTWEFRLAFWQGYQHQPYFLVLKTKHQPLALLPLWYEADRKKYFWFGSWWQEDNRFLVKDELLIPLLLAVCPQPVVLNAMIELPWWLQQTMSFTADDPKYILDLTGLQSVEDFLLTLKKKKRYNLKRDQRLIEGQQPQVLFNRFEDFPLLVKLSKQRFAQKGETTDWDDSRRVKTFS